MTTDRDRLAADLKEAGIVIGRIEAADRLIALGWTRLDVLAPVVTVEGPEEDGSYGVSIVAMPGHIGAAMTIAEAAVEAADAAEAWLEAYRDIDEERLAMLREELAALEHEQWAAWATTLMATEPISDERKRRWSKLLVGYDELTEEMKDHDRKWADRSLAAIAKAWEDTE